MFELVLLILTLVVGIKHARSRGDSSPLILTLVKDGILYYLCLFVFSLLNIVVPLRAPPESVQILIELQRVMHSVLSGRILIHLRKRMLPRLSTAATSLTLGVDTTPTIIFRRRKWSASPPQPYSQSYEEEIELREPNRDWFGEEDHIDSRKNVVEMT